VPQDPRELRVIVVMTVHEVCPVTHQRKENLDHRVQRGLRVMLVSPESPVVQDLEAFLV